MQDIKKAKMYQPTRRQNSDRGSKDSRSGDFSRYFLLHETTNIPID